MAYPLRYWCDIMEDLKTTYRTRNFSYLLGLIGELQYAGEAMERALEAQKNIRDWSEERSELDKALKSLKKQKKALEVEIKDKSELLSRLKELDSYIKKCCYKGLGTTEQEHFYTEAERVIKEWEEWKKELLLKEGLKKEDNKKVDGFLVPCFRVWAAFDKKQTKEQIEWAGNDDPNELLKIGKLYEVESLSVHSQSTCVVLKDFPDKKFNTVTFTFKEED